MITKIGLENIRLFDEREWSFKLNRLTIFCGTNSAGKSTILKSILLLQQSQGIYEVNPTTKSRLRFAGSQVDLGSYRALVSNNDTAKNISISLSTQGRAAYFGIGEVRELERPTREPSKSSAYTLDARFTFTHAKNADVVDSQKAQSQESGMLESAEFTLAQEGSKGIAWAVNSSDVKRVKTVNPYIVKIPVDVIDRFSFNRILTIGTSHDKQHYVAPVVLKGLMPESITAPLRGGTSGKAGQGKSRIDFPLPSPITRSLGNLRKSLADIHYLGPLRSPAKRYYVSSPEAPQGMDSSGDFLPSILRENEQTLVECSQPVTWDVSFVTLSAALNRWLEYLRTGSAGRTTAVDELRVSSTKEVLVEFELKDPGGRSLHSVADSGFGYSQVLPILVRGLLAGRGSTLIVEQPELHLNPALQIRLAEFFISLIKSGKQVLIETHSEHIVNSVRALAAEDVSDDISSASSIYFVDASGGVPEIHDLSIQPDGTVPGWPRQFFGEALTLTSRLLAAQKQRRSVERKVR
ncbi:AAA family ATPase [Corallococcus interemptor]|uniref:AAA family ATPase n=1 Tax=Corallococcus interemptor TaxID=2316720 RepID=UPI0035D47C84